MFPHEDLLAEAIVTGADALRADIETEDETDELAAFGVPILPRRRSAQQTRRSAPRTLQEQELPPGRTLRVIHEVVPLRIIGKR